jgi:DNA-directed RNA polymerase specialized sigma24 family protein
MASQAADEAPSDAELVHAAWGGDGLALGTLLDRHRAVVNSHALHFLGRRDDAADAVQPPFVAARSRRRP